LSDPIRANEVLQIIFVPSKLLEASKNYQMFYLRYIANTSENDHILTLRTIKNTALAIKKHAQFMKF